MCLHVNPAGNNDGKDTHLSVFLYLMKGHYDDELTWPLRGKFEVKFLNQISDCKHHSWTMIYDDSTTDVHAGRITNGYKGREVEEDHSLLKTSTRSLPHVSISKMIVSSSKLVNYRHFGTIYIAYSLFIMLFKVVLYCSLTVQACTLQSQCCFIKVVSMVTKTTVILSRENDYRMSA